MLGDKRVWKVTCFANVSYSSTITKCVRASIQASLSKYTVIIGIPSGWLSHSKQSIGMFDIFSLLLCTLVITSPMFHTKSRYSGECMVAELWHQCNRVKGALLISESQHLINFGKRTLGLGIGSSHFNHVWNTMLYMCIFKLPELDNIETIGQDDICNGE